MKPQVFKQVIKQADGPDITIETGALAKQAHGSVVVTCGKTMLLGTVVSSYRSTGLDFLPLTVDFREKFASAGKYPGGFFKREARPNDGEVLTMRLVDRVLRPLFPKDYHAEVQVMIQLMSHDENVMPDALAGLAASTAIQLSDIPFECPISEVRVGRVDGEFVINPSFEQLENSDIDMMIGASADSVMMVEGEMSEISEEEMLEAIKAGHEAIKEQCAAQVALVAQVGAKEVREYEGEDEDEAIEARVAELAYDKIYEIAKAGSAKKERSKAFSELKEEIKEQFSEEEREEKGDLISKYFSKTHKKAVRDVLLKEGIRLDGRKTTDIRDIWCEVDYLPSTHGSSIFSRGETQALATVTLGTSRDANIIDMASQEGEERFYLHYNFPPFSTGEARPLRGTSRREVGHGNLAQRALKRMLPDDLPYTVRVVSEVLESNGSSSMATVCAGTMALMDAGLPMKKPVSGIAMGLITEGDNYAVLSDILGDEDHLGDMDFKVTGTEDGITACQMDIKVKGLSYEILTNALMQARDGRLHILNKLTETIEAPRSDVKPHAPKMESVEIDEKYIGAVIGPGGKIIQEMQKETDTVINIEERDGMGIIEIAGTDRDKINAAKERISNIIFEPEVGSIYEVKVVKMLEFGAVVEFKPGKETLLHVSEFDYKRIEDPSTVLSVGDVLDVKYLGIDPRTKKQKVSRKAVLPKPEGWEERPRRTNNDRNDRGRGRDDRHGGDRRRDDRRGNDRRRDDRPRRNASNESFENE
jgi:polyribonucleotide nucleotidyltransferase